MTSEANPKEFFRCQTVRTHLDERAKRDELDPIVSAAAQLMAAPIALVSLVEQGQQLFVAGTGLEISSTPREFSFCSYALLSSEPLEILDATRDHRFVDNPLVNGDPEIRYYIGFPITDGNGWPLGTLCVIDNRPRIPATDRQRAVLHQLARAAEFIIRQRHEIEGLRAHSQFVHEVSELADDRPIDWLEGLESSIHAVETATRERRILLQSSISSDLGRVEQDREISENLSKLLDWLVRLSRDEGQLSVSATLNDDHVFIFFLVDMSRRLTQAELSQIETTHEGNGVSMELHNHEGPILEVRVHCQITSPPLPKENVGLGSPISSLMPG